MRMPLITNQHDKTKQNKRTHCNLHNHRHSSNSRNGKHCQRRHNSLEATAREAENVVLGKFVRRLVSGVYSRVDRAVPAVALEALGADVRDWGVGAFEGAAEDCAAHASRPFSVQSGVSKGSHIVAVFDDVVALGVVVHQVEGADVAVVDVRCVGQVDHKGSHVGGVAGVAAEECRAVIQAEVDESLLIGDGRERGAVGDG
jgi:hypothetical protein